MIDSWIDAMVLVGTLLIVLIGLTLVALARDILDRGQKREYEESRKGREIKPDQE